jgi:ribonucleotide monophosphatase NagD (HAD superfamily)
MKSLTVTRLLSIGLLMVAAGTGSAETLVVNDELTIAPTDVVRPARGSTMQTVEAKFGAPQARHNAVGKPPITRWDYAGFSVFFENQRVIHAVATAP